MSSSSSEARTLLGMLPTQPGIKAAFSAGAAPVASVVDMTRRPPALCHPKASLRRSATTAPSIPPTRAREAGSEPPFPTSIK